MCAQYRIVSDLKKMARRYGFQLPLDPINHSDRILPHLLAPVVVKQGDELCFKEMNFSLIPSWSKERRTKFATHNARFEDIETKPTWRDPFRSKHCLVPISEFYEPIYKNEHAGYMVGFKRKDGEDLFAAGIHDQWIDKSTGEVVDSFAIITADPPRFVADIGHDRCPLFVKKEFWPTWLGNEVKNVLEMKKFLTAQRDDCEFEVERDRPMRPGWEKRK